MTPRLWIEIPALDPLTERPAVQIIASKLRAGMVLLDPELKTPAAALDHKMRTTRGSGNVEFLTFDYDRCSYVPVSIHTNTMVWVAAR